MKASQELTDFLATLKATYPNSVNFTRAQVNEVRDGNIKGHREFIADSRFKVSRGLYFIPGTVEPTEDAPVENQDSTASAELQTAVIQNEINHELVPPVNPQFVPFGDFKLIKNIIESKQFYPIYITGESGNGKTEMIYQACGELGRELVRANITSTTDEEDLIGGFRLYNGETRWENGPATLAMERGAVLLLDEVNLGTEKTMCLQPVLEGKPIFVKKINKYVYPAPGFTVMATANTKGKGSADGRYVGSQILNEAFLDRFPVCIEQEYPSKKIEFKILSNLLTAKDKKNPDTLDFAKRLCEWAEIIRKTFDEGGIDEMITTRRLRNILDFYIFAIENRTKAIEYNINRFDVDTKNSMISLYQKVDESIPIPDELKSEAELAKEKEAQVKAKKTVALNKEKLDKLQEFVTEYNKKNANGGASVVLTEEMAQAFKKDDLAILTEELKKRGVEVVNDLE